MDAAQLKNALFRPKYPNPASSIKPSNTQIPTHNNTFITLSQPNNDNLEHHSTMYVHHELPQSSYGAKVAIIVSCTVGGCVLIAAIVLAILKRKKAKSARKIRDTEHAGLEQIRGAAPDDESTIDSISAEKRNGAKLAKSETFFGRIKRQMTGRGGHDESEIEELTPYNGGAGNSFAAGK
ncbi:hypothetical protein KEM56_006420 [Ascosphaera pollenicola]|nr:hypothetical protein KEM56_006420 [Ascosphaera pollenicola]